MALLRLVNHIRKKFTSKHELFTAVKEKNIPSLKKFFEIGFSVNEEVNGYTLLSYSLLHDVPESTVFLLKNNADPNLKCTAEIKESNGKALQPYLKFWDLNFSSLIFERNSSIIRLLVLHGAVVGQDEDALQFSLTPPDNIFKSVFDEAEKLREQIKELEKLANTNDWSGDGKLEQKLAANIKLQKIWQQLSEAEKQPRFAAYKAYYQEKADFYAKEVSKLRQISADDIRTMAQNPSLELGSPNSYHPPINFTSTKNEDAEKNPLLPISTSPDGLRQRQNTLRL